MLHTTTDSYSVISSKLNNLIRQLPKMAIRSVILNYFAKAVAGKQMLSSDVVLAWRDVGVNAMQSNLITFNQWCVLDQSFAIYIETIYGNSEFTAEVIAQKNMDIRNGETL